MSDERTTHERLPAADHPERSDRRVSPRVAVQISVGVHALLAIAFFRMVTEYACQPDPPLRIVARAAAPRDAAAASFIAAPSSATVLPNDLHRPTPRVEPLPHQTNSWTESDLLPLGPSTSGPRRDPVPAVLPSTRVAVPTEVDTAPAPAVEQFLLSPSAAKFERADTLRDTPLRPALQPVYGTRQPRPLGLAELPAARGDSPVRQPTVAFAHRYFGPRTPPENRAAIDRGLEFLARVQQDDGRWQFRHLRGLVDHDAEAPSARADAAATGLALLAFLGAGHDHFGGRYQFVVRDGLGYLVRTQHEHGEFFPDDGFDDRRLSRFYSHGIAALALCEALGMTGDQQLRPPAQRALDYLVGRQYHVPGSWRFLPGIDADASAVGWQLAALRSGQLAGLDVDAQTLEQIRAFLARRRRAEAFATDAVTSAVGLAVELHLGDSPNDERLAAATQQMLAHPPEIEAEPDSPAPADAPQCNTYYWYFGSEAMHRLGGDHWQNWSQQLFPKLIESQVADGEWAGSWDPHSALSGPSWCSCGGRLYLTAMNLLSLEIDNRPLPPQRATVPRIAERPEE